MSKSSKLKTKIMLIAKDQSMIEVQENEYLQLVNWITYSQKMITKACMTQSAARPFLHVSTEAIISSVLRLLDTRLLSKDL